MRIIKKVKESLILRGVGYEAAERFDRGFYQGIDGR